MAETIHAVFDTVDEAIAAVEKLQREGAARSQITIMSSEPVHIETSEKTKTRIGLFAIAGGALGAAAALALTVWTSRSVDIVTGGMPIVAPWPFGIIVFEMSALGAILATLGRMIYEARLLWRAPESGHDEEIADGRIVVAVECADETGANSARAALGE
jgi:hypothetical protein